MRYLWVPLFLSLNITGWQSERLLSLLPRAKQSVFLEMIMSHHFFSLFVFIFLSLGDIHIWPRSTALIAVINSSIGECFDIKAEPPAFIKASTQLQSSWEHSAIIFAALLDASLLIWFKYLLRSCGFMSIIAIRGLSLGGSSSISSMLSSSFEISAMLDCWRKLFNPPSAW